MQARSGFNTINSESQEGTKKRPVASQRLAAFLNLDSTPKCIQPIKVVFLEIFVVNYFHSQSSHVA